MKMQSLPWLGALLLCSLVSQQGWGNEKIQLRGEVRSLELFKTLTPRGAKAEIWVSSDCLQNIKCEALLTTQKASTKNLDLTGGINPGVAICRRIGGSVEAATDLKGNGYSLCRFPDGSLVSCPSVHTLAIENDRLAKHPK